MKKSTVGGRAAVIHCRKRSGKDFPPTVRLVFRPTGGTPAPLTENLPQLAELTHGAGFRTVGAKLRAMNSALTHHVLVLNRLWQAVNVCTARRALTLLFQGHAQVVLSGEDGSFQTFNFSQWHDFSQQEPHPESIHTISFRIRVPRVILLVLFLLGKIM